MDTTIGNIFAVLLIVFLIFVGPVYDTFQTTDKLIDTTVKDIVNKFEKETRKEGYINNDKYMNFLRELSKTGRVYEVNMIHTSKLVYPSSEVKNDYEVHEIKYGTNIILETVKDGDSKYCMRYGDDFKLLIKEKEVAPSRMLIGMIAKEKANLLEFTGGGMVENEVVE